MQEGIKPAGQERRCDQDDDRQHEMLGAVGDDVFGKTLRDVLVDTGVDASGVKVVRRETTGVAVIQVAEGDNAITGAAGAIAETLELAQLPSPSDVIGPVLTADEAQRVLIRVPRQLGGELASSLKAAAAIRSARKAADPVRIVLDPSAPF